MSVSGDGYYVDQLREQPDLEGASQLLARWAEDLGWDLAAYHVSLDARDLPRAKDGSFIAALMGWPTDCLVRWREAGLGAHCPVAQRCGRATAPFAWSCDARDSEWFGSPLTRDQRRVLEHYGRYISSGIAVPVQQAGGTLGYVSWCSRSRERGDCSAENLATMHFLSHVFIRQVADMVPSELVTGSLLTAREKQCLTLAALGKNEHEIASVLNRSRETVHFHIRNCMWKLGAANRTHAVALACTRGIIRLN
ncbi:MAG TPA: autoinducer binding domain-containing protein [Steroidobacteraceae bacterium]